MEGSTTPRTDYSKIAERYDKLRPSPADIWVSKIIEYGDISDASTVLDVGCGTGRYPLSILNETSALICALDPSVEMLERAIEKDELREILWIRGDGQRLPFRRENFDCVYMTLVIHHIEDKMAAIEEIYHALRENGKCVIMTNSHSRIKKQVISEFPGIVDIDLKRFPTVPNLRRIMKEAGFASTHHHPIQHNEYMSTEEYLERVRNKYISTLTLLSEGDFRRGFDVFKGRVLSKFGSNVVRHTGFDFIVGEK